MKITYFFMCLILSGCSFLCPYPGDAIYTVRPGDTLETISIRFYGSELKARLIMEANYLKRKGQLEKGQKLIIPHVKE